MNPTIGFHGLIVYQTLEKRHLMESCLKHFSVEEKTNSCLVESLMGSNRGSCFIELNKTLLIITNAESAL